MADTIKRYIITGAPGTGKSTTLEALRLRGHYCYNEISREIIKEQQEKGGDIFPWTKVEAFSEICYMRMQKQLAEAPAPTIFYDRGIPDIIAYLRRQGKQEKTAYHKGIELYEKKVFLFPGWKEIFINDDQRPESYEEAMEVEKFLRSTYREFGFEVIEVPICSIAERIVFIEEIIG